MKTIAKKLIYLLLCGVLIIMIVAGGLYLYKNRNAETVIPENQISSSDTVFFYQKDKRWAEDNLGSSKYKMSDSGCLVTCIASMVLMQEIEVSGLEEITPKTLNEYFSENGVYDSEGNLDWTKAGEVLGVEFVGCESSEFKGNGMEKLLNNKEYPIVCVKTENGNYHFVLVVGSDEDNFLCMDPMNEEGETVSLSRFDDKIYSVRYCRK
ncbi:MAG: hypothetical protein IJX24_03385 [Oscillospiraceae bacterium]|nr:hypothetical protein [Oscillospiraceae bacterium]